MTTTLTWQSRHHHLHIQPWGTDSIRVRANLGPIRDDTPHALLPPPETPAATHITTDDGEQFLHHGRVIVRLTPDGALTFIHSQTGQQLLAEKNGRPGWPPARYLRHGPGDLREITASFMPHDDEKFYGLGQRQHGRLDQKGCVIPLQQYNTEVNIPFLLSNRGYGFLWNNPAVGRVELAHNGTRWVAEAGYQLDYWVTVGDTPAEILWHYADITGHAPMLPEWATGFWQSKLRYRSQAELMDIAREYQARGLPLSAIVVDGLHWTEMGEWRFDRELWPDPASMVQELQEMGVEVVVSAWHAVSIASKYMPELLERGLLVDSQRGYGAHLGMMDANPLGFHIYDPTNPEARAYLWERLREGYYQYGIRHFWLDAGEPEIAPNDWDNLRYHLGPGTAVSNLYPREHARAVYEGLQEEGETEILTLNRSAWAGSQRFATAVWSGDVDSTFEALANQVAAGLNIGLSGIPWWTTDIGGFHNGDPRTPYFQELIVRWFQYGLFCPLFRLHGFRDPKEGDWWDGAWDGDFRTISGGPNEVWSFGEKACAIIKEILFLRERLRPYLRQQMKIASETGLPPMRPLFVDFPADETSWTVEDQFMLGADLLVAPVVAQGVTERRVYLPLGARWVDPWRETVHEGGQWLVVPAPLTQIPYFVRQNTAVFANHPQAR